MLEYLKAHWRGELSLVKSVLVNGLILYVVFVAALVSAGQFLKSEVFLYSGMAAFFAWGVWSLVGIVRCAIRSVAESDAPPARRIFAVFSLIGVAVVVYFSIGDIWQLFVGPMTR